MDFEAIIRRQAEVTDGTKRCRICDRVRPFSFFAKQSRRYYKSYCKPCHQAFQSWRGKIDRDENRTLTVAEFRDEILPVLIQTGHAKWAEDLPSAPAVPAPIDPNADICYWDDEPMTREAFMERFTATAPMNLPKPSD